MIDAPLVRPPRPRAVRMAGWAPARHIAGPAPGMKRKSLGFLGLPSLNLDQTTFISAAIGGAGVLLSDAFDPPVNTLVKIAGFGALGYAVYHLFGFDSAAPAAPAPPVITQTPGPSVPSSGVEPVSLYAIISTPRSGESVSPSGFFSPTYPVKFSIANQSEKNRVGPFDVEFRVVETSKLSSNVKVQSVRKAITLDPLESTILSFLMPTQGAAYAIASVRAYADPTDAKGNDVSALVPFSINTL